MTGRDHVRGGSGVLLYWLPLGAGGHVVRWNGRVYEAVTARWGHRSANDLYHSALEVVLGRDRWVIEMAPVWSGEATDRGVVRVGPVGVPLLGASALFRYEVRCWRDGVIPDADEAVASPVLLSADAARARRVVTLVADVPALTWGRDELGAGDMWNSNSLISWVLARSGHDVAGIALPENGRAPGWQAGLVLAAQQTGDGRLDGPAGDPSRPDESSAGASDRPSDRLSDGPSDGPSDGRARGSGRLV